MKTLDIVVGIIGLSIAIAGGVWYQAIQWAHPQKTTRLLWLEHSQELMGAGLVGLVGAGLMAVATVKK